MDLEALEAIVARIGGDDAPTDTELADARAELVEAFEASLPGDGTDDIEAGNTIAEYIDRIDTETTARADAETERAEQAASLRSRVLGTPTDDTAEDDDTDEVVAEAEATEPQAVAASARLATAMARARQRRDTAPPNESNVSVSASGPAQGARLADDPSMLELASVANKFATRVGRGTRQSLIHFEYEIPEDRRLGGKPEDNDRALDSILGSSVSEPVPLASRDNLAAAGGICDPLPADYTHPVLGDRARPIRDALPRFGATRGGVRFTPAISFASLNDHITVWTNETDESPGSTVKACPDLECEPDTEARVDAIVACATVGNFQTRYSPEWWRARWSQVLVAHDRIAEQTLYATMTDPSVNPGLTAVTYSGEDNTLKILEATSKAAANLRSRHRLVRNESRRLRVIYPDWVQEALRTAVAAQIGSPTIEALHAADNQIARFFSARGIVPIWSPDIAIFDNPTPNGALPDWPDDEVEFLIYPEGNYFFLDGGTLDLGVEVRDSELNSQNNLQAFVETFEQVATRGPEAILVTVDDIGEAVVGCCATDSPAG